MANRKHPFFHFLFFILLCATIFVQGSRVLHTSPAKTELNFKEGSKTSLIGSVAPICTYNECRGCKYKCRAEQVPIEGNDPINSPYHYKCVCHM